MAKKLKMDWLLFAVVAALSLFGVAMVYSSSAIISMEKSDGATQFMFLTKQFFAAVIGLVVMYLVSKIHYKWYQHVYFVYGFYLLTVGLLVAVFFFPEINGAQRWIRFPGFSFQPSEFAKISLPIFLAFFLTRNEKIVGDFRETLLPCSLFFGVLAALVFYEPDLGTVIVLSAIFVAVYFAAGAKVWHLASVAGVLGIIGTAALIFSPWRMARLAAFIDPCSPENRQETGYQVCQSLMTIGSGGILGEGFAHGQQKMGYLPYPYSDFIFAIVGEELGLIGTLGVVFAFGFLLWRGARAAVLAPDRFGMLLGMGLITGIIVQALFNISVAVSILPAKGIPLPFISFGGSSIIVTMVAVGILLNISQHAGFVSFEKASERASTPSRKKTTRRKTKRKSKK